MCNSAHEKIFIFKHKYATRLQCIPERREVFWAQVLQVTCAGKVECFGL